MSPCKPLTYPSVNKAYCYRGPAVVPALAKHLSSTASGLSGKAKLLRKRTHVSCFQWSGKVVLNCSATQVSAKKTEPNQEVLQFPEVCDIAKRRWTTCRMPCRFRLCRLADYAWKHTTSTCRGMFLSLKTVGPLYTIDCKDNNADGQLLATTNGFVLPPLKLMHCDTMRVFTRRLTEADKDRVRGGSFFGLSLLIVAAIMSHGHECGCRKAEMLAINDDDHQHQRLVKYYARLGFHKVLEVGNNGLSDLPHLLVWGGAGTRMDCVPQQFLHRWAPLLRRSTQQL